MNRATPWLSFASEYRLLQGQMLESYIMREGKLMKTQHYPMFIHPSQIASASSEVEKKTMPQIAGCCPRCNQKSQSKKPWSEAKSEHGQTNLKKGIQKRGNLIVIICNAKILPARILHHSRRQRATSRMGPF